MIKRVKAHKALLHSNVQIRRFTLNIKLPVEFSATYVQKIRNYH